MTDLEKRILQLASNHPEYDDAIATEELAVMSELEVLEDLIELYKKTHNSSPGSLNQLNSSLAYYLGITSVKPTEKFQLSKRRTYGRAGFPDIDMDFDYMRRHEIVEYVISKYGREYVGNIGNVMKLKTKNAVRRAIKVLDPTNSAVYDTDGKQIKSSTGNSFALENEILRTLPNIMKKSDGNLVASVAEACKQYPDFARYMKAYPEVCRVASAIEGTISGFGSHAAGVIISPIPLARIAPLHVTTRHVADSEKKEKIIATQFPMADIENMGLIKFDILGLSTETAVKWACDSIKEEYGVDIDWNKISLDDELTLRLINSGKTIGCFQLESRGMQEAVKMIGIESFDHIVIAIAMYRPGPKDYIPELAKRKRGQIPTRYAHPLLKKITESTYGIICYQESVMQAFMMLSGLTASDGYLFTKGCAKKKPEIVAGFKSKFFKGCQKNGISKPVTTKIWNDLEKFAGYSFNKSHSVSYAFLAYKTAYLKAHYPTELMAARLSVETLRREFDVVEKYEYDVVNNFGFKLLNPSLNESKLHWSVVSSKDRILRRPMLVKGVGVKAATDIVKHQPYDDNETVFSFASKVGKAVNAKILEAMKDGGMWKGIPKEQLIRDFECIRSDRQKMKGRPVGESFV